MNRNPKTPVIGAVSFYNNVGRYYKMFKMYTYILNCELNTYLIIKPNSKLFIFGIMTFRESV